MFLNEMKCSMMNVKRQSDFDPKLRLVAEISKIVNFDLDPSDPDLWQR